ncbi:hypothetical protein FJK98_02260 [Micromonospora sp. HM134]|uniref:hypothetical protein n=1 Tax=Micromonospora sp. HM134 TaxID=2583243 RepID=UPI0011988077|nr:hypothetical protein [Micromonospora sp. HM134]QDY06128.1 hypothetical protein FJK98_02260 [Micromonospora sp. HM134]
MTAPFNLDANLDAIEADLARYDRAIGPGGEKAWSAGQLVQYLRPLIAEVRRLRAAQPTAPAAEPTDRQLLAAVHRWARTHGWTVTWVGWANAGSASNATIAVAWDDTEVTVYRRPLTEVGRQWYVGVDGHHSRHPVASVRQAVDVLVALDVLPAELSSAYRAAVAGR